MTLRLLTTLAVVHRPDTQPNAQCLAKTVCVHLVEIWFSKIERDMIARGIFTSKADLRRKLLQYVRAHNKDLPPVPMAP